MSEIHFGVENCYFSVLAAGEYNTPVAMPGAVAMSVKPDTEIVTTNVRTNSKTIVERPIGFADRCKNISLEVVSLPCEFLTQILNYEIDNNGVLIEKKQQKVVFALLYETRKNGKRVRHLMSECVCNKPEYDCTTLSNTTSVNTRKLNIVSYPNLVTGTYGKAISENENETIFDDWFCKIY